VGRVSTFSLQYYTTPTMPVRKPCKKPAPYAKKPGPREKHRDERPKMSTTLLPVNKKHDNLTFHNLMVIFAFIDAYLPPGKAAVVEHFGNKAGGTFVFTQSTLSHKMKDQKYLEARLHSNPNALSSQCPCVVARPDVECALGEVYGNHGQV
jgi:hypothetical protein